VKVPLFWLLCTPCLKVRATHVEYQRKFSKIIEGVCVLHPTPEVVTSYSTFNCTCACALLNQPACGEARDRERERRTISTSHLLLSHAFWLCYVEGFAWYAIALIHQLDDAVVHCTYVNGRVGRKWVSIYGVEDGLMKGAKWGEHTCGHIMRMLGGRIKKCEVTKGAPIMPVHVCVRIQPPISKG